MGIPCYSLLNTEIGLPLHSGGIMGQQVLFRARTDATGRQFTITASSLPVLYILYCYHQSNEESEMKGGKKFSIIAMNSSVPAACSSL